MNGRTLQEFTYSPGYSDMRGARHSERLRKNEQGAWVVVLSDRPCFGKPTTVTTYAASDEAVASFEAFLAEKDAPSLAKRRKSDEFIHDYSPFECRILYADPASAGGRAYYRFCEYQRFSAEDRALIAELRERFRALRGEKLSEEQREDD